MMKNILRFILFIIITTTTQAFAGAIENNLKNYLSDKNLFENTAQRSREIHFFWSSGRKLKDVKKYTDPEKRKYLKRDNMVYIGGKPNVAKEFKEAVSATLYWGNNYHPDKIRIKLVIDKLTYQTNKKLLKELKNKFKKSFDIVYIDMFKKKLKDKLNSNSWEKAKIIFANADSGNPAIASDVYRLVFPLINPAAAQKKNIFIYCDVDSFVDFAKNNKKSGLDSIIKLSYASEEKDAARKTILREALFPKENKRARILYQNKNLILFSKSGANDITVIKISDPAKFNNYAEKLFNLFDIDTIKNYNLKYQYARKADTEKLIKIIHKIQTGIQKPGMIKGGNFDIVNLTGPNFIAGLKNKFKDSVKFLPILLYFPPSAGSWFDTSHRLKYINIKESIGLDKNDLLNEKQQKQLSSIKKDVKDYIGILDAASYVLKLFGENNPAHKKIKSKLRKENPFESKKFKDFVKSTIADEEYLELVQEILEENYQNNSGIIAQILRELEKHGIKYDIVKLVLGENPKDLLARK